jgi:hypothetical protein
MFPFLASFIVFCIWLTYQLKKHEKLEETTLNDFWSRERQANQVRKKSLDNLPYVEIPFDYIPRSLLSDNEMVQECLSILDGLSEQKIVNFTGYTNTDLKLQYGTANLTLLSKYDENYTLYARTLYQLASIYYENGYESNARLLLEKAVESGTDITGNYTMLADIYQRHDETERIQALLDSASSLHSSSQKKIIRSLEEYVHKN